MDSQLTNVERLIAAGELLKRALDKGLCRADANGVYYRGIRIGRSIYDAENSLRENKNGWTDALNTEVGDFDGCKA